MWHNMKPCMYSYRMRPGCSGVPESDNMLALNSPDIINTYTAFRNDLPIARQLDEHLGRVCFADVCLNSWIWHIPRQSVSPTEHFCATVTTWLKRALKAVGRTEQEGQAITSHILRAGAMSAFILVNPAHVAKAKWLFGWAMDSSVAEENYVAWSWTVREHPRAKWFFGVWGDHFDGQEA